MSMSRIGSLSDQVANRFFQLSIDDCSEVSENLDERCQSSNRGIHYLAFLNSDSIHQISGKKYPIARSLGVFCHSKGITKRSGTYNSFINTERPIRR